MAKNEPVGNPDGSCERIYKATLSTIKRVSHCSKNNVPSPANAKVSSTEPMAFRHPPSAASAEIPVEFRHELLAKPRIGNENKEKVNIPIHLVPRPSPKVGPHQGHVPVKHIPPQDGIGGKKLVEQPTFNGRVSNYIDRVKNKMRAPSNVGRGRSFLRRDSFNDRVSNYINRAKFKLKSTTTIKSNEDQD